MDTASNQLTDAGAAQRKTRAPRQKKDAEEVNPDDLRRSIREGRTAISYKVSVQHCAQLHDLCCAAQCMC